jgi:multidrug efflux pump subunit AcrA (membrane-fusion protein)
MLFVYNTGLVARLVGKGAFKGQEWTLGAGTFTVGREPTNNLVLDKEPGVSKVHCKITLEDGKYHLMDAESRNGTLLNGKPIKKVLLSDGDEIRVCNAIFGFEQELAMPERPGAPSRPPAPPAAPPRAPPPPVPDLDLPPPPVPVGAFQPPPAETTERMREAALAQFPKPPKPRRGWPYFLLGMMALSVGAAAAVFFLDMVPPQTLKDLGVPSPAQVLAGDLPWLRGEGTSTTTSGTAPAALEDGGIQAAQDAGSAIAAATSGGAAPAVSGATTVKPTADGGTRVAAASSAAPPRKGPTEVSGRIKITAATAGQSVEVKHTLNARVATVTAKTGKDVKKGQVLLTYDDTDAQRRLATAREQYNAIKEVAQNQDTERARKALAEARADLDRAVAAVANLRLNAPMDGVVAEVKAEAGKRAGKGTAAVIMGSSAGTPSVKVTLVLPPDAKTPATGSSLIVEVSSREVAATVDSVEKTPNGVEVTATLAGDGGGATDGAVVTVRIP